MTTSRDNPKFRDGYGERVREIALAMSAAVPDEATLSQLAGACGVMLFSRAGVAVPTASDYDRATDAMMAAMQGSAGAVRQFLLKRGAIRDDVVG